MPGYEIASWERGYGDFDLVPDLATLRRIPWLEATALVLCDVQWHDGSPVRPSPRQVLRAQVDRAAERGLRGDGRLGARVLLLRETYEEAHAKGYRGPDAVGAVHPRLPHPRPSYDEPLLRQIRNGMQGAGIRVETSKGEAWPGQQEINFRYADAVTMADNHVVYKNGAKEIAHLNGCSITFMAKPDHTWIGSSCHIHSSLWRGRRERVRRRDATSFRAVPRRPDRVRARARAVLRAERQLVQAVRGRLVGADDARVGARQPHVRLPHRRLGTALRVETRIPGGDVNPYLAFAATDRGGAARHRERARAAARARGERVRVGRRAVPVDAARGDRGARGRHDGAGGARRRRRRALPQLRAHRAEPVRQGRHVLGAGAAATSVAKPVVGITTYLTRAAWGAWELEAALVPASYVRAVVRAGGVPLLVPPGAAGSRRRSTRSTGSIFSGGSDLDPELYGAEAHAETAGVVRERDDFELALMQAALARDLPVLAICRGSQVLNVALGGDLEQHVPDRVGTRRAQGDAGRLRRARGRRCWRTRGSASILGERARREVAPPRASARSATGLREAARAAGRNARSARGPDGRFALGVLWHPEEGEDLALFEALVAEAAGTATARSLAYPRLAHGPRETSPVAKPG